MSHQYKILVVDDDDAVRTSLHALFESYDFNVTSFSSGLDFLAQFQDENGAVLILDINLPDISGIDVLSRLRRERRAAVSVIMISGHAGPNTSSEVMAAGADGFFAKPFDGKVLISAVERLQHSPGL